MNKVIFVFNLFGLALGGLLVVDGSLLYGSLTILGCSLVIGFLLGRAAQRWVTQ